MPKIECDKSNHVWHRTFARILRRYSARNPNTIPCAVIMNTREIPWFICDTPKIIPCNRIAIWLFLNKKENWACIYPRNTNSSQNPILKNRIGKHNNWKNDWGINNSSKWPDWVPSVNGVKNEAMEIKSQEIHSNKTQTTNAKKISPLTVRQFSQFFDRKFFKPNPYPLIPDIQKRTGNHEKTIKKKYS